MTGKTRAAIALLTLTAILGPGSAGIAAAQEAGSKDLRSVSCRDVLLASGEERDGIILVLHAYLLGEAKQPTYNSDALAEATDRFLDACIEEPKAQALGTMRRQVSLTTTEGRQ